MWRMCIRGFGGAATAGCAKDVGGAAGSEAWARRVVVVWVAETMQRVVDVGG
jgi:hypothetical protein